jgi:hypothetical protein
MLSEILWRVIESWATASVVLSVLAVVALASKRCLFASLGFAGLGFSALGIVWDQWSERTGHHMEIWAVLDPVPLTEREVFLLATHLPLLILGVILLSNDTGKVRKLDRRQ